MRLVIITSHPIQYQVPLWRALSSVRGLEVEVLYASDVGVRPTSQPDRDFCVPVQWDVDLLSGYRHRFLNNRPLAWVNRRYNYRCPEVKEVIKKGGYDALLLVGKEYAYYLQAFAAAREAGIPVLYRADTPPPDKAGLRLRVAEYHRRRFYAGVAAFCCLGKTQYRYYERYGIPPERMFWTPYCVDNTFFRVYAERLQESREKIRAELGFSNDVPVVMFAGKFIPKKRPLDLLNAIHLVARKRRCGLLMVGDGPLRRECEAFVRNKGLEEIVRFVGFKNQTEIPAMYVAADCFVLPSGETWGLVVNEAMNFALPIIVSDQVGCGPDLVHPGENGFIYPMGNVEALAQCIEEVLSSPEQRAAMGARSHEIVAQYSIEENVRGILAALEFCCGRPVG